MSPATATPTDYSTATATTTATTATTPTATPSLFRRVYKRCKVLLSIFSPCGSSALSEELTAKRVWNSASNPPISSVISKVTASIHNASTDKKMRQMMDSKRIYTRPTVCMLARLSDCTLQIKYCGGNAELPVLSLDYHSIMSFEMSKCGEWRSNTLRPYNFKIVMTIPDNKCAKGDKVLTIWMNELNESVAFAKYVYDTLLDTQKADVNSFVTFE
ncbi:hypothetical protein BASA60_006956 [Batrachochytrium salamandrivorans]|nr:hypothetical protein BASA60_006956 [Batrachochytrium salamandrivorans]